MITETGMYKTKCGMDAKILEITDKWAIGYWGGAHNPAPVRWSVDTGVFIEGVRGLLEEDELSLILVEKKLKLFSDKSDTDSPERVYLDLKRVDKDTIRVVFVDTDGDIKVGGHLLSITSEGVARHSHISSEFNDYIKMDIEKRVNLFYVDDLW